MVWPCKQRMAPLSVIYLFFPVSQNSVVALFPHFHRITLRGSEWELVCGGLEGAGEEETLGPSARGAGTRAATTASRCARLQRGRGCPGHSGNNRNNPRVC